MKWYPACLMGVNVGHMDVVSDDGIIAAFFSPCDVIAHNQWHDFWMTVHLCPFSL